MMGKPKNNFMLEPKLFALKKELRKKFIPFSLEIYHIQVPARFSVTEIFNKL